MAVNDVVVETPAECVRRGDAAGDVSRINLLEKSLAG